MTDSTSQTPPAQSNNTWLVALVITSLAVVALIILLVSSLRGGSVTDQIIGVWQSNDENGIATTSFNANGTFRWEDGKDWQTGTWTRDGNILSVRILDSSYGGIQPTVGAEIVSVSATEMILIRDGQSVTYTRQ